MVEDEDAIQSIVDDTLSQGGFKVAIAKTKEEAVTVLKGRLVAYRALVIDTNLLGRFSGWEVARAVRDVDPNFPVVYVSGVAAHEWPAQRVPKSIMLQKPFAPAQVTIAVSQLLNERSGGGSGTA
ncbi:DNA-binding response OmpR family regulator [Bradyrhizobium japonicum USDA 38]|uniref:response regulator n=1 Tax=Bradyrhizobium japonicum TaxID=375 RepID=UPI001FDAA5D9|nr:response regulator [Bradyrhizobium japonicum]MCS3898407.1 DNA-binding response OmpR family regulator [Bradyrhizobium japonicum USDA 38]MCS3941460.1 DNA-binding response OmpR family regulator [Bradyrhizobium japonicum]